MLADLILASKITGILIVTFITIAMLACNRVAAQADYKTKNLKSEEEKPNDR